MRATLDALHAYRDTIAQTELRSEPLHLVGVPLGPAAVIFSVGLDGRPLRRVDVGSSNTSAGLLAQDSYCRTTGIV
jgi:hypothetical protein